jgi:hypothetical protein
MPVPTPTVPFPALPQAIVADQVPRNVVLRSPVPGGQSVRLTAYDGDGEPRIEAVFDVHVGNLGHWAKLMRTEASRLPPARTHVPLFGPRLVP